MENQKKQVQSNKWFFIVLTFVYGFFAIFILLLVLLTVGAN